MDRFDDVEYQILEGPEQRAPRRRSPRFASVVTVVVATGLFAASALANSGAPAARQAPDKASSFKSGHHHGCRHRDRGADAESLGLRY